MIKNKIIAGILLIFIINFAYSQERSKRPVAHTLGLDVSLGYPVGTGLAYRCTYKRVTYNVAKIQLLNFYNEDLFMQYMAGFDVYIGRGVYMGIRGGYWHLASSSYEGSFGGFCLEPELRFNVCRRKRFNFNMAITYNYLAYIDKGVYRGSVRAYPELKLGFHFKLNK